MTRAPWTATMWINESTFIEDLTDGVLNQGPTYRAVSLRNFSGDIQTLIRYCEMQHRFALQDGFLIAAQCIRGCADDLILQALKD